MTYLGESTSAGGCMACAWCETGQATHDTHYTSFDRPIEIQQQNKLMNQKKPHIK